MNRKDFLKRLSLGVAAVVVAPKLLIEESQYEVVEHPFIPMTGEPMGEYDWMKGDLAISAFLLQLKP